MLAKLLKRDGSLGLIEGIGDTKVFQGIKGLQLVDDTLLFCVGENQSLVAAKALSLTFKSALGLKINLHKSTIFCLNGEADTFVSLMNYKRSSLHISYLGLPLCDKKLPK